jgi:hypothetical protein
MRGGLTTRNRRDIGLTRGRAARRGKAAISMTPTFGPIAPAIASPAASDGRGEAEFAS